MKKNSIFLVSIGLAVLIAGCTMPGGGGGTAITGNGLVITSFQPEFDSVRSGDSVQLLLEVQNTGQPPAKNIKAYLFGINPAQWGVASPLKDVAAKLEGPEEEPPIPGEMDSVTWDLTAPALQEGVSNTYQPRARVFYEYSSAGSVSIPVLSESEYKMIQSRGEVMPQMSDTIVTKGPLGVKIDARTPVVIREGGSESFRLVVTVTNIGSGNTYNLAEHANVPTIPEEKMNQVELKITAPGAAAVDCDAMTDWQVLDLRGGSEGVYNCELQVSGVGARMDLPVTVDLRYGYMQDAVTSIRVTGA